MLVPFSYLSSTYASLNVNKKTWFSNLINKVKNGSQSSSTYLQTGKTEVEQV